ncbi:MAG: hypothetical protein MJZ64_03020 [Paludibacteraceae bacterium]|nr:hypothetical protein [Paludibacteraceae bacterium]
MKKLFLALMAIAAIALTGCEKKSDGTSGGTSEKVKTISATDITSSSALLTGQVGVEIADYKSVEFGMLISEKESDLSSYEGKKLIGDKLLGQTFSIMANGLSAETKYYYRAYLVLNNMQYEYGEVKSFKTEKLEMDLTPSKDVEAVDLGLSVKWANMNVGATKPEGYGAYFAWGETSPKNTYNWDTYKWCNGSDDTMTKYCTSSTYGTVDNKTILDLADDAAHVNWGGAWRMPTKAEQAELRDNCTRTWTSDYKGTGVRGYIVSSKKNSNSIFLPASGYRNNSSLYEVGSDGDYWSSSLRSYDPNGAYYLFFYMGHVDWDFYGDRYYGHSVRPVCQ